MKAVTTLALVLLAALIVVSCVAMVAQKGHTQNALTGNSDVVQDIRHSVEQTVDGLDEAVEQASDVVEQVADDVQNGAELTMQDIEQALTYN